ncbi:MAG: hypothetical protein ACRBN8_06405 [Nannocystales bacterium]
MLSSRGLAARCLALFAGSLAATGCAGSPAPSSPPVSETPTPAPERSQEAEAPDPGRTLAPAVASERPLNTIFRSEIDRALARGPGYLLYELGPEPYRLSGKFVGWEITKVFPDEPDLCSDGCDLQLGDIILSVNGDRLETPQALSNMVDALPSATKLVVKSIRDEKRRTATYVLADG